MFKQLASALALSIGGMAISHAAISGGESGTHRTIIDDTTGLAWSEFSTLAEGQAQGFRLATDTEFAALMGHAGLEKTDYGSSPPFAWTIFIDPTRSAMSVKDSTPLLTMGLGLIEASTPGIPGLNEGFPKSSQNVALVGSTLGSGEAYRFTAITATTSVNQCQWSDATGSGVNDVAHCGTSTATSALIDTLREFGQHNSSDADPAYRSYLSFSGLQKANDLAHADPGTLGFYMVQTIPEAGTASMMSLGLMGLAALGARKRRQR